MPNFYSVIWSKIFQKYTTFSSSFEMMMVEHSKTDGERRVNEFEMKLYLPIRALLFSNIGDLITS